MYRVLGIALSEGFQRGYVGCVGWKLTSKSILVNAGYKKGGLCLWELTAAIPSPRCTSGSLSYILHPPGSCTPLPVPPSPHHKPLCNKLWTCFSTEHYESKAPV